MFHKFIIQKQFLSEYSNDILQNLISSWKILNNSIEIDNYYQATTEAISLAFSRRLATSLPDRKSFSEGKRAVDVYGLGGGASITDST